MEVSRKLISNTLYLVIGWIGSIILNFTFQLLAAKTLLPEELGILSTAISFSAVLASILVFGMEQTTQRLTSFYSGKNKDNYLHSVLWFFLLTTIFLNIIAIICLLLFSSDMTRILKIPHTVFLFSVSILLPFSISFFLAGILRGYQNMRYLSITAVVGDFLKLLVSGSLLVAGFKIFGFLTGYAVSILSIFFLRIGVIKQIVTKFKMPDIKLVVKYAIPSFTTQIFWLLLLSGQYLIITIVQDTYATGLFTVGMILASQIYYIPRIISDALFPITSKLSGNKNSIEQQRSLLNIALRYSFLISLPILFFISIFPQPLIFLIGRVTFFPAASMVPILVTASLFFGVATLLSRTLYAIGRTMTFQMISIVFTIYYLISSITLTYFFSAFGTSLAYLSTTILMTIVSLYYLGKYMAFKVDYPGLFKIFTSSFATFYILYVLSFQVPNLLMGGILTAFFTVIYFIVLYFLNFYNENEIKVLDFISERFPSISNYSNKIKSILLEKIKNKSQRNKQNF